MSSGNRQNFRQNPNQNQYNQNQNYNNNQNQSYRNNQQDQNQNQNQQQSGNQLQISVASRRALDLLKKSRANRSAFMIIGPNETVRLQFDPTKSHVEKKIFNGQTTERIAHSVVNVDDRAAGEKTLSLNIQTKSASRRSNGARIHSHGYNKNWRRNESKLRHKTNRIN